MVIQRDFYLEKLIQRKGNGLIKVITGIRRCGKSYLLNNLFYLKISFSFPLSSIFVSQHNRSGRAVCLRDDQNADLAADLIPR